MPGSEGMVYIHAWLSHVALASRFTLASGAFGLLPNAPNASSFPSCWSLRPSCSHLSSCLSSHRQESCCALQQSLQDRAAVRASTQHSNQHELAAPFSTKLNKQPDAAALRRLPALHQQLKTSCAQDEKAHSKHNPRQQAISARKSRNHETTITHRWPVSTAPAAHPGC